MRSLASIQTIKNIEPITNSDFLEKATVLGWGVVVKKGQFQIGDKCVFFEIDSLLPDIPKYEFLKKTSWNKRYNKIRLKTVMFRGCLSQGLAMPLSDFPELDYVVLGDDVTDVLGVEKYEPYVPPEMEGKMRGFDWPITKTDETRIQSNPEYYLNVIKGLPYYISVKLDGTSASYLLTKDDFHVCSRSRSLVENDTNAYWLIAKKYKIKEKLEAYREVTGINLSIQGEIVGPGIQGNKLGLKGVDLFVFNIVDTDTNAKLSYDFCVNFCSCNGLKFVPVVEVGDSFEYSTLDEMLEKAEGKCVDIFPDAEKDQEREGIVIRSKDQKVSFKTISNKFLLKGGD